MASVSHNVFLRIGPTQNQQSPLSAVINTSIIYLQAEEDSMLEEYDQFDDYLEMVVQFGVNFFLEPF